MNESRVLPAARVEVAPPSLFAGAAGPAAPNAPKISVDNLDFFYGETHALKSISVDAADRKVTAMIGPSG